MPSESIELRISVDPELQDVEASAGEIERISLNLAFNARDAMPQGGRLDVDMDEATRARILDPCSPPTTVGLTDVVTPKLGGESLVRTLQAERPELRALFMTGYAVKLDGDMIEKQSDGPVHNAERHLMCGY